ncbi:MAG: Hsp70 family protein [Actinobacteria bacterium]|nr:Hsp70 family protein [Actinomycetota bacterium]
MEAILEINSESSDSCFFENSSTFLGHVTKKIVILHHKKLEMNTLGLVSKIFLLVVLLNPFVCHSLVIGIDFGSEWFKVALVKGKSVEVALNEQSSRKTASAVAFTDDLLVGTDAKNLVRIDMALKFCRLRDFLNEQFCILHSC